MKCFYGAFSNHWDNKLSLFNSQTKLFINIVSFVCIRLKSKPKCIVVKHLSGTSVYQYTTANYIYSYNVVFKNVFKSNIIGTFKDSWSSIISFHLPTCVNLVLCPLCLTMSWFLKTFTRVIVEKVYVELLTNSINFLIGFYHPLYYAIKIPWCM